MRGDPGPRNASHDAAGECALPGSSAERPEKQSVPDGTLDSQKPQDGPGRNGARGSGGHVQVTRTPAGAAVESEHHQLVRKALLQ